MTRNYLNRQVRLLLFFADNEIIEENFVIEEKNIVEDDLFFFSNDNFLKNNKNNLEFANEVREICLDNDRFDISAVVKKSLESLNQAEFKQNIEIDHQFSNMNQASICVNSLKQNDNKSKII